MRRIVIFFLTWKFILYIFLFFSLAQFTLQFNFLGGGIRNYLTNPFIWSFVNFDGEHYLAIAREGYRTLTYFYFPVYPLFIKLLSKVINFSEVMDLAKLGLLISNNFFLIALLGLYKLIRLDYSDRISILTIILLLLFPTSFYFGSFYNESMFLGFIVWSLFFARKKYWLLAGILGVFASATRVIGIAIFPALLTEAFLQWKKNKSSLILPLFSCVISLSGIILYVFYLYHQTGNPLEFVDSVGIFGQQRSSNLILLTQVFYRYIFKILPNLNYNYLPIVFSTYLELLSAIIFGILTILIFFKLRLSYAIYSLICFLVPTLSGSFSSFPRYVLVIFPAFILSAIYLTKLNKYQKIAVFVLLLSLLAVASTLYFRGYWVS